MILQVTRPNQQRHCTEGQCLVNCVKGQSHQASSPKGKKMLRKIISTSIGPIRELNQARSKTIQ